jgi:phosphate/phosphite/phosphonate ABC transporters, periplasmic binding protein
MKRSSSLLVCIMLVATMVLSGCGTTEKSENAESTESAENTATQENKPVFKIGAIPDQDTSELEKGNNAVATYLSEYLGLEVEFVPTTDYTALVKAFERGEIQCAWFGGLTSVQAMAIVPEAELIIQRPVDQAFESVFIKNIESDVNTLEDLKGSSFTFGSESSTSGHLMPRHFMQEAGIIPEEDLSGNPNYSGSHDTTYKLVEAGTYEAGALNFTVWNKAVSEGSVDTNKVEVFYTTPQYYDYAWILNAPEFVDDIYGEGTGAKVTEAFESMNDSEDENAVTALAFYQTDKWIKGDAEGYKDLEEVAKQLGMLIVE